MDDRQVKGVCLEDNPLLDPTFDDTVGTMHTCPQCMMNLSMVECSPGCPHWLECEDRELHVSGGVAWCPVYQVIESEGILDALFKRRTHARSPEGQTEVEDFGAVSLTHASVGGDDE